MVHMVENATENAKIDVTLTTKKKNAFVSLSCRGTKYALSDEVTINQVTESDELDEEEASVISNLILKSLSGQITLKYKYGYNRATIALQEQSEDSSYTSVLCLFMGALLAILFKFYLTATIGSCRNPSLPSSPRSF